MPFLLINTKWVTFIGKLFEKDNSFQCTVRDENKIIGKNERKKEENKKHNFVIM